MNTTVATSRILRVDIRYDDFPQEISWALAQQQRQLQKDESILKYVSPRQSISVRNQLVSQHFLNLEPGVYLLEFYDTVAGDGIVLQSGAMDAAIQVWQVTLTTTITTNVSTSQTPSLQDESENASNLDKDKDVSDMVTHHDHAMQLLWSHKGDFGEFVRATVEVSPP